MKVLVIESNVAFKKQLLSYVSTISGTFSFVDSVDDVVELASCEVWDVVVISTDVAGCFCFAHRCASNMPQTDVIVTSARYSLQEKLKCYEMGIEMYLVQPVAPVDLLNAIDLLCDRRRDDEHAGKTIAKLSVASRTMTINERVVRLSEKECLLLHALVLAEHGKLESWQLMECLGIADLENGAKYLGIIVSRLRTKLKEHGLPEDVMKTLRGQGYQLTMIIHLV